MGTKALSAAKLACERSDWSLTNLQLQKILYLAHMIYAGMNDGERLIEDEDFEAWDFGPVLPSVYHRVKSFGGGPIKNVFHSVRFVENERAHEAISKAVDQLAKKPAFGLVKITHDKESAWSQVYDPNVKHIVIPHELVMEEFNERFGERRR